MNKRGEKLLSIWWFLVLVIITVGVIAGTSAFYSAEVDVRGVEAKIMAEKAAMCLSSLENISLFNLSLCGFKENLFDGQKDFYLSIKGIDSNSGLVIFSFSEGKTSFEKDCEVSFSDDIEADNYPACYQIVKRISVADKGRNTNVDFTILAGSNQKGKRSVE